MTDIENETPYTVTDGNDDYDPSLDDP